MVLSALHEFQVVPNSDRNHLAVWYSMENVYSIHKVPPELQCQSDEESSCDSKNIDMNFAQVALQASMQNERCMNHIEDMVSPSLNDTNAQKLPTVLDFRNLVNSKTRLRITDFSIKNILSQDTYPDRSGQDAGPEEENSGRSLDDFQDLSVDDELNSRFAWLRCSRYKPPKLPRRRDPVRKRQLSRGPRIPFSNSQVATLEKKFRETHYLSSAEVGELAKRLGLTDTRVKIWFQNRRAREKREQQAADVDTTRVSGQVTSDYSDGGIQCFSPVLQARSSSADHSITSTMDCQFPSIVPPSMVVNFNTANHSFANPNRQLVPAFNPVLHAPYWQYFYPSHIN